MNYKVFLLVLFITPLILAQTATITIDNNASITLDENNTICSDGLVVNNGSSLWAFDFGQIQTSDCSSVLTPTGDGTITLPVETDDSESIPNEFNIESAYPNPFNPITTIKYGIPERSQVDILIYDINGNLVSTLFNAEQEPGWYVYTWNGLFGGGKTAATGVYILKIITSVNNHIQSKSIKITFIK